MSPKEIAAHYEARVFDSPAAAETAGFALTEKYSPRNVWNKASAAQSLLLKLRERKEKGEVKEIGRNSKLRHRPKLLCVIFVREAPFSN
jgi:hypothetical protein